MQAIANELSFPGFFLFIFPFLLGVGWVVEG